MRQTYSGAACFGAFMLLALFFWLPQASGAQPVTAHPRLWVRQADLPRLRARAVLSNPMYQQGFLPALNDAIATYNQYWPGGVPNAAWTTGANARDPGISNWVPACTEAYAEFFAFASLIDNDPVKRADYAQRAHNMIMYVINEAAKGAAAGQPFRDPMFSTYNRANYWSEAFGVTVDWVYTTFSAKEKAAIRKVFLRWCDECAHASTTSQEHPQPVGVTNSPQLLSDLKQLRYAANNYFTGHMRHITLMSLALDEADDKPAATGDAPAGALRAYIAQATGGWLYMQYAVYEDAATVSRDLGVPATGLGVAEGGLSAEGFMYGHALGYLHEALLALYTAGYGDPALSGPQIKLLTSKYWDNWIDAHLHSITPTGATPPTEAYLGPIYQMASYGDILRFWITPDLAAGFGSLGAYDQMTSNTARLAKTRWIVANTLEGGPAKLYSRCANIWGNADASVSIMNFMLYDPADPSPPDPRPALPKEFFSKPLGRILAHSDWTPSCSWFTFINSWNSINHQNGCGGQFEFYRKGEWLTKEKSGYAQDNVGATPDFHNTLALMNDVPPTMQWYEGPISARGGQWKEGLNAGDPTTLVSLSPDFVYAYGDLTNLYNRPDRWTPSNSAVDIQHASRSILWLKPDHIIVYDRARSGKTGRFKRFNLNLLVAPAINGRQAVATMPSGQRFFVQNLLPAGATLTAKPTENYNGVAELEPSAGRLVVEDPSNPTDVRFLHVLQGADAGVGADPATLLRGDAGTPFDGAIVRNAAILFPVDPAVAFTSLTYTTPAGLSRHYVTGLKPGTGYGIAIRPASGGMAVTITPSGAAMADSGGVLAFTPHFTAVSGGSWAAYP